MSERPTRWKLAHFDWDVAEEGTGKIIAYTGDIGLAEQIVKQRNALVELASGMVEPEDVRRVVYDALGLAPTTNRINE